MKITNFNSYNLDDFVEKFHMSNMFGNHNFTELQVREMLSPISITFFLENINRMQSMLLCEEGFSYVHQSQRYVAFSKNINLVLPENTPEELIIEGKDLIRKVANVYQQMTVLKEDTKNKKRHTAEDFEHGIPYEDARYMIPLCVPTNIAVTFSGDRLIDLYNLFYNYPIIMNDIKVHFNRYIDRNLINMIMQFVHKTSIPTFNMYTHEKMELYNSGDNVHIIAHSQNGLYNAAYGALASQNAESPENIINKWKENEESSVEQQCENLVNNVMSYGHKSIIEQMRNTVIMKCSLSTYHQVIRHRIHKIQRDDVLTLGTDDFKYYIPESIEKHEKFSNIYHKIMKLYQNFFEKYNKKYSNEFVSLFLPNAALICFVVNSNASNDNWIFRERLCLTAQTEIRELYDEKFRRLYYFAPNVYHHGLPPCVRGKGCKEGKMTCGKWYLLSDKYDTI